MFLLINKIFMILQLSLTFKTNVLLNIFNLHSTQVDEL